MKYVPASPCLLRQPTSDRNMPSDYGGQDCNVQSDRGYHARSPIAPQAQAHSSDVSPSGATPDAGVPSDVTDLAQDRTQPRASGRTWTLARYRQPIPYLTVFEMAVTLGQFVAIWAVTWWMLSFTTALAMTLALANSALIVRLLVTQNDSGHRSLFRHQRLSDWVGRVIEVITLTLYDVWRPTHAIHHAMTGKLDRRGVGNMSTLRLTEDREMGWLGQSLDWLGRHPVLLFSVVPFYTFFLQNWLPVQLMRSNWRYWANLAVLRTEVNRATQHSLVALAVLLYNDNAAFAQGAPDLPLWELGIGGAAGAGSDYPGSTEYREELAVFPYITYRGRLLEIGDEATLRFIPIRTDRFELGFTVDGSSAVDSKENALRGSLPDLDALIEFGPEFNFRILEFPALAGSGDGRAELSIQSRGVFSVGDGIDRIGSLLRPALRYRQNGSLRPGSRISASIGPIFATEGVHDYFYQTPAYDAEGGFLGTEIAASFRYPLNDRLRLIGSVAMFVLSGNVNDAGPLIKAEMNGSAYLGLTFSFYQSRRRAMRDR